MSRLQASNRLRSNLPGLNNENPQNKVVGKGGLVQPTAKATGLGGVQTRRALAASSNVNQVHQSVVPSKEANFKKPFGTKSQSYGSLKSVLNSQVSSPLT
jgi:hypothetical protein